MESGIEQIKFMIVGVVCSPEYQRCKFIVEQLRRTFPERFQQPVFRAMLDVAWFEYRAKMRRRSEEMAPWCSEEPVAVFMVPKGTYVGDSKDLQALIDRSYTLRVYKDFEALGLANLKSYLDKFERTHVYFIISIQGQVIGSLLFQLYGDIVPLTCANFLKVVKRKHGGYKGSPVHRICKTSWIQIGGYRIKPSMIPCENYAVPHERRGVLSMCNDGKHINNSTQFFISLDPTPWMDYKYVAFGQLIHGDAILQQIENIPTLHECPVVPIVIEECGEFTMVDEPSAELLHSYRKYKERLAKFYKETAGEDNIFKPGIYPMDVADPRDAASIFSLSKFQQGLYSI